MDCVDAGTAIRRKVVNRLNESDKGRARSRNRFGAIALEKQAAEELGLTRTSITRASGQLKGMGLITEEQYGREMRMKTVATGYKVAGKH